MKYRRIEADSFSVDDQCQKCSLRYIELAELCINSPCELADAKGKKIPFYFIEESESE